MISIVGIGIVLGAITGGYGEPKAEKK